MKPFFVILMIVILAVPALAAVDTAIEMGAISSGGFPGISFPARVTLKGEPVRDLVVKNFRVQEDGQPITDFKLELRRAPLQFALVLDASGSVKDFVQRIRDGANTFIDGLGPRDEALVVRFSTKVTLAQKRTTDHDSLKNAVDGLHPAGGTRLFDAVWRGMEALEGAHAPCLVLFTDGKDELGPERPGPLSTHTVTEVVNLAKEKSIALYTIGVGSEVDRPVLESMAKDTGGKFFYSPDPGKIVEIYQNLSRYLNVSYVFRYTTPNLKRDGKWRTVEVLHLESDAKAEGRYRVSEETVVKAEKAVDDKAAGGKNGGLKLGAPQLDNAHLAPPQFGSTDVAPPVMQHTGDVHAPQLQGVPGWTAEDQAAMDGTYDSINQTNRQNTEDTNQHLSDTYDGVNRTNRQNSQDVNESLVDDYDAVNSANDDMTDDYNTDMQDSTDSVNETLEDLPGMDMNMDLPGLD